MEKTSRARARITKMASLGRMVVPDMRMLRGENSVAIAISCVAFLARRAASSEPINSSDCKEKKKSKYKSLRWMDDQKKLSFDRAENMVFIGFLQENESLFCYSCKGLFHYLKQEKKVSPWSCLAAPPSGNYLSSSYKFGNFHSLFSLIPTRSAFGP